MAAYLVKNKGLRLLLYLAGWFSLIMAGLGIVFPILPTTPFLLLATLCFMRSSPKLHGWLTNHPKLGPPINNYFAGQGISAKNKAIALVTMWASLLISAFWVLGFFWAKILLPAIGLAVSWYLLSLPTYKANKK